jgi:hypothetical protein
MILVTDLPGDILRVFAAEFALQRFAPDKPQNRQLDLFNGLTPPVFDQLKSVPFQSSLDLQEYASVDVPSHNGLSETDTPNVKTEPSQFFADDFDAAITDHVSDEQRGRRTLCRRASDTMPGWMGHRLLVPETVREAGNMFDLLPQGKNIAAIAQAIGGRQTGLEIQSTLEMKV